MVLLFAFFLQVSIKITDFSYKISEYGVLFLNVTAQFINRSDSEINVYPFISKHMDDCDELYDYDQTFGLLHLGISPVFISDRGLIKGVSRSFKNYSSIKSRKNHRKNCIKLYNLNLKKSMVIIPPLKSLSRTYVFEFTDGKWHELSTIKLSSNSVAITGFTILYFQNKKLFIDIPFNDSKIKLPICSDTIKFNNPIYFSYPN